jgi:hypothetical protein
VDGSSNDELARRLSAELSRSRRPPVSTSQAPDTSASEASDELAKRVGADIMRLRRLHTSAPPAQDVRAPEADELEAERALEAEQALETEAGLQAEATPEEASSLAPQEITIKARPVADPSVLTETERYALFVALAAGTEEKLGRKPTAGEFVRLCDALVMARQLVMVERHLFYGGMKIYWNGAEWVVEETCQTEGREVASQAWAVDKHYQAIVLLTEAPTEPGRCLSGREVLNDVAGHHSRTRARKTPPPCVAAYNQPPSGLSARALTARVSSPALIWIHVSPPSSERDTPPLKLPE